MLFYSLCSREERELLHSKARVMKDMLSEAGLPLLPSVSHITPVLVGDAVKCKAASEALLREHGIYVQPINYPTVPQGTERLRITVSPTHTTEMMVECVFRFFECLPSVVGLW